MVSGDLLHEARRRAGLSQAGLARQAGTHRSAIGRWERGEVEPGLGTLVELIRACGLELRFRLAEKDQSQDAAIEAALELTPEQRLAQLEAAAAFILEARAGLGAT